MGVTVLLKNGKYITFVMADDYVWDTQRGVVRIEAEKRRILFDINEVAAVAYSNEMDDTERGEYWQEETIWEDIRPRKWWERKR